MAKKKKPAGNPARGFATTSVASKPKAIAVDAAKESVPAPLKDSAVVAEAAAAAVPAPNKDEPVKQAVAQTPEELEAQLEHDELQLLVEKHAAKVRRESRRQVTKFETDRRVLRAQSHPMTVHDWLPNEILDTIISLAQTESNDSNRRQGQQQSLLKVMSEEDAMSKLWTLNLTLRDLGFSHEQIEPVLRWLCADAAGIDAASSVWGLQEALEWLALDQCEGHSFSYEETKPKQSAISTPDVSRPGRFRTSLCNIRFPLSLLHFRLAVSIVNFMPACSLTLTSLTPTGNTKRQDQFKQYFGQCIFQSATSRTTHTS
jgi:ATP-dependent RNA helicase DHX29